MITNCSASSILNIVELFRQVVHVEVHSVQGNGVPRDKVGHEDGLVDLLLGRAAKLGQLGQEGHSVAAAHGRRGGQAEQDLCLSRQCSIDHKEVT